MSSNASACASARNDSPASVLPDRPRAAPNQRPDPVVFWQSVQHGGNSFNAGPPEDTYFRALRATGATWVRLAFAKWPASGRDFLIGNADHYTRLSAPDLIVLIRSLDAAQAAGLKVVLVPLSLPGDRWSGR